MVNSTYVSLLFSRVGAFGHNRWQVNHNDQYESLDHYVFLSNFKQLGKQWIEGGRDYGDQRHQQG